MLEVRREVGEWVSAWVIVELISPNESPQREHRIGIEQPVPRRRDVEGFDLRTLISRTDHVAIRIKPAIGDNQSIPSRGVFGVERIRRLEPRTRVAQIQVNGVRVVQLKVQTVEYVLFVSLSVYDAELRRIQKAPAIQAIGRDEIAPFLATVPQVEAGTGGAETAVRSGDGTVWRGESLT